MTAFDALLDIYTIDGACIWLTAPHKLLGGDSAMQRIKENRTDDVLALIDQLNSGAPRMTSPIQQEAEQAYTDDELRAVRLGRSVGWPVQLTPLVGETVDRLLATIESRDQQLEALREAARKFLDSHRTLDPWQDDKDALAALLVEEEKG